MLTPLSWLKDYVDIDVTPKELEEKLFSCGFEVEESYEVGKDISNVVVGLVEKCEPIPETHLSLCQVNAGAHGTFQICCGADNVKAGGKYPLALIGATVYATAKDHVTIEGVMEIKQGKLRGYDSYGMLCSGVELGLNEDLYPGAGYNGLLVLPEDAKAGDDVKPILGLDDWIFDIAITANRPDCQCIYGMAREVAAVLGKELKEPALDYTADDVKKENFKVSVLAQDICPRYTAHYVHDVKISESPAWMRKRLALVGIGSISNVVDITNVMVLAGSDKLRCAALRLLAIDERNALTAHTGIAVAARHHERREHLLEFCFGHLRERRASEVLHDEELEIRLAYAHLIERLVVCLCGYGVLHVVLSSLEVAHLSLELIGHTLGASERDVVVGAEHYSVNRSAAFIEKYLLLRVGCSNESYDERKY